MKWGDFDLNWGRPLKSILSVYNNKIINFDFHHLVSSNSTFTDKDLEEKKKFLKTLKHMRNFLKKRGYLLIKIKD